LSADNTAAAVWLGVKNVAVLNDGSNPDIIATNIGNAFVPKTPETFGSMYQASGLCYPKVRFQKRSERQSAVLARDEIAGAARPLLGEVYPACVNFTHEV